ncbi:MAG: ATP-binding cassette domain-containing protein, partial [Spirochaetales bacterium]
KKIHFQFPPPPPCGKKVLQVENLEKSYGNHTVLRQVSFYLERGEKLTVVGPNGAGKSTLLRMLALKDPPSSGEVLYGMGVAVGYFSQDQEETLPSSHSVLEEIEASCPTSLYPKIRDMLGAFLFRGDEVYKSISVLSGGERNRLSLLKLLLRPVNLLILDEPTNHLDVSSKDVLMEALQKFAGTVIFVSHDRYFMDRLATKVLELRTGYPPRLFVGNYSYYLDKIAAEQTEASSLSQGKGTKKGIVENPKVTFSSKPNGSTKINATVTNWELTKQKKAELRKKEKQREELLNRIEQLEELHQKLQHKLALPEVYQKGEEVRNLKQQLEANESEREQLLKEWEEIEQEIETLQQGLA